jgi:hypothetical protein
LSIVYVLKKTVLPPHSPCKRHIWSIYLPFCILSDDTLIKSLAENDALAGNDKNTTENINRNIAEGSSPYYTNIPIYPVHDNL